MKPTVVPPYLLARIVEAGDRFEHAARAARVGLDEWHAFSGVRGTPLEARRTARPTRASGPDRRVSDAGGGDALPGRRVRSEGDPATGDVAADEAWDGLGATYAFLADAFGRDSIDGAGLPLEATVHYRRDYDNAFWDGERMVFGDGDGEVFGRFTASLSVIGHELAHGVTQYTTALEYQGQPGALNEHVSDVLGALVEQHAAGQAADEASWLIGAGLFTDAVQGVALRSMAAPGTAYDDDVLGRDPQPAHLDDYVVTDEDAGGVHLNSGIPNKAFHLVATALGGHAWERAGRIWWDTITAGTVTPTTDFAGFAAATLEAATARYGVDSDEVRAVTDGWAGVGLPLVGA